MSSSEEGSLVGFEENPRDLRTERREKLNRLREAEERIRIAREEIGQGEDDRAGLEQEVEGDERSDAEGGGPSRLNPRPSGNPVPVDPMQLIMQQLRSIQEQGEVNNRANAERFQSLRDGQRDIREDNASVIQQLSERIEKNATVCAQTHKSNSEQIIRNATKIAEVSGKVDQVKAIASRETAELRREVNNQVEEVKSTVENLESSQLGNNRFIEYPRERRIPEELKFGGRSEKPIIFLRELRANLGKHINRWEIAKDLIKMYLVGPAREWYILCIDDLNSFSAFELRFKQQYWSVTIQSNIRRKIENGSYSPFSNLTPNEYLTSQRLLAKQFVCYEDELQFVLMISRHFDDRIQEAQINGGITTIQRLSDILEAYYARDQFQHELVQRSASNVSFPYNNSYNQRNTSPPRFGDNRPIQPNNRSNYYQSQPNSLNPNRNQSYNSFPNNQQSFVTSQNNFPTGNSPYNSFNNQPPPYRNSQYNFQNRNSNPNNNAFNSNRMNSQNQFANRPGNVQRFQNNQSVGPAKPSANAPMTKN
jgi:hypothetical protein